MNKYFDTIIDTITPLFRSSLKKNENMEFWKALEELGNRAKEVNQYEENLRKNLRGNL